MIGALLTSAILAGSAGHRFTVQSESDWACLGRLQGIAGALDGMPARLGTFSLSTDGAVIRMDGAQVRGFCDTRSGRAVAWNPATYGKETAGAPLPPAGKAALGRAKLLAASLDADGLLDKQELDFDHARVSREAYRAGPGDAFPVDAETVVATHIGVRRILGGVPVFDSGLRLTLNARQEVTAIDLHWRSLDGDEAIPVAAPTEAALSMLEVPPTSSATILQDEVAYVDMGRRAEQGYYEPWRVILYVVRTPTGDPHVRRISKRLVKFSPMTGAILEPFRQKAESLPTAARLAQ